MPRLKCLSIRQPWADLIVGGRKLIENRSRRTHYRGPLGIHASKSTAAIASLTDKEIADYCPDLDGDGLSIGGVIGTVELLDCVRYVDLPKALRRHPFADRGEDNWCWILGSPRRFATPVAAKGNSGFFYVDVPTLR